MATKNDGQGRSQGESSADSTTQSRFSAMMGPLGQAVQAGANTLSSVGSKAASIGADVLGSTGVGHQAPYFGQSDYYDTRSGSPSGSTSDAGHAVPGTGGEGQTPGDAAGGAAGSGEPPTPPTPPTPTPPTPAAGVGGGGSAGAGAGAGSAAEVPVVPV